MRTRVSWYDPMTNLSDDYWSSCLPSKHSSLEMGYSSHCLVSNVSSSSPSFSISSSGYGTHACLRPTPFTSERSRSISDRQVSGTLDEVCSSSSSSAGDDKKYTPYSLLCDEEYTPCSPLRTQSSLLPDFGQTLLPDRFLKKTPESFLDIQRAKKVNVSSAYLTTSSAQTADSDNKENRGGPTFSASWQKEQTVSHHGGIVHTDGSAVLLEIPPAAVPVGETLTIRACVSTSLDQAYTKLALPETELIASPIAEYFARVNFKFLKPVSIVLPHFLPPKHTPEQVSVYVFRRDPTGKLSLQKLKLWDRKEEGEEEDARPQDSDVFAFGDGSLLEIFTDHFSGYLCTCQVSYLLEG